MITQTFENRDDWLFARRGKITGSRLKDIVVKRGTGHKIGFYEVIAERVSTDPYGLAMGNETPMERGTRLEPEAMQRFMDETGKDVDTSLVMWMRDENEGIAISPDGFITEEHAGVEVKCLSSARHIEAYLTQAVPDEYVMQIIQYFIVNDDLEKVYMVFYDPRVVVKDFFFLTIKREDIQADADAYLEYQKEAIKEIDNEVAKLTNF